MDRVTERAKGTLSAGLSASDARRKREETNVKLRKQRRDEHLKKKRELAVQDAGVSALPVITIQDLEGLVQGVMCDNPALQLEATTQFRKLLSIEENPPIKQVVATGVIPRFIQFLSNPDLQFEAAWALTNIASGASDDTCSVVEHGAVPHFVQLLQSSNIDVREQAVWALGNIAGDSPSYRDLVLSHNALVPLVSQLNESTKLSMLRNGTWTLSNLCRGKPPPDFNQVHACLPTLSRLIFHEDEEVLTDACWALSYLSDGDNFKIQAIIDAGVAPRLVALLMHPSASVQTPALRAIGNIVTGDDSQTQAVLNVSLLPCLLSLLSHSKRSIVKETCWTISNITAGTTHQIHAVLQAGLITPLVELLDKAEFEIRKEAAWAISNATSGGSTEQIAALVALGCVEPLCGLLQAQDVRMLNVSLEALENILRAGEDLRVQQNLDVNPHAEKIEAADGLDMIEQLQNHSNKDIYERAHTILETYFDLCDADNEDEIAPETQNGQFRFGAAGFAGGFQFE